MPWKHRGLEVALPLEDVASSWLADGDTTLAASFHKRSLTSSYLELWFVRLNGRYRCPWVFLRHWKDCGALVLWHFFGVGLMQHGNFDLLSGYRWPLARGHTLGCVIHQHVGEPTPISFSTIGMHVEQPCATMGKYGYRSNWRNLPTSLWRGTEWSGGLVVLKRSFTVSLRLLDVFSGFWVGVGFCFGLVCFLTSSLLRIYLLSNSLRSVDRPCHELDRQTLQKLDDGYPESPKWCVKDVLVSYI